MFAGTMATPEPARSEAHGRLHLRRADRVARCEARVGADRGDEAVEPVPRREEDPVVVGQVADRDRAGRLERGMPWPCDDDELLVAELDDAAPPGREAPGRRRCRRRRRRPRGPARRDGCTRAGALRCRGRRGRGARSPSVAGRPRGRARLRPRARPARGRVPRAPPGRRAGRRARPLAPRAGARVQPASAASHATAARATGRRPRPRARGSAATATEVPPAHAPQRRGTTLPRRSR